MNWHEIRSNNGSQHSGFERLCAQLARSECPPNAEFVRKGTPDAGVECFCVLPNGGEWGWQAKYLFDLRDSQWNQIDESVKTALDKHPRLVRYYVCVPKDRADGRKPNQTSAMDRWNDRVTTKWKNWAEERGMDVEFVWWGDSELTELLSDDEHRGTRFFWFGQHGFDQDWFMARWRVARRDAGPRYTPEANVELPIVGLVKHFERHPDSYDEIKGSARELNQHFEDAVRLLGSVESWDITAEQESLRDSQSRIVEEYGRISFNPGHSLSLDGLRSETNAAIDIIEKIEELASEHQNAQSDQSSTRKPWERTPAIDTCLNSLRILRMRVSGAIGQNETIARYLDSDVLLLTGVAGTGKTHLICDVAYNRVSEGLPTLVLLGQWFTSGNSPWSQISEQLGLGSASEGEIIGALESAAQAANCRALVMIDALNEGDGIDFWRNHLGALVESLKATPWVGLVVSVRTGYDRRLDLDSLGPDLIEVEHMGFAGHEYDATRSYCEHYGFEFPSTPLLNPEFSNPLVLKMIFKGLKRQGIRELPRGFSGITVITESYLDSTNQVLADKLDFDAQDNLVQKALRNLGGCLANDRSHLPRDDAKQIVDSLLPNREFSRSLFKGMLDERLLIEWPGFGVDGEEDTSVSLGYERFSDYIVAQHLFELHIDPRSSKVPFAKGAVLWFLKRGKRFIPAGLVETLSVFCAEVAFARGGGLSFLNRREDFIRPGLVEALSVFCAENLGVELLDLVPRLSQNSWGAQGFVQSVIWRRGESITDRTIPLLNTVSRSFPHIGDPLRVILNFSTDESHPLNAKWLDERLRNVPMPDRDACWSIFLHETYETNGALDRLIAWTLHINPDDEIDDRVVDLASITLGWMLTTSHRFVRDNATKALVTLLIDRFGATQRFVRRFVDVDDPYVTERVYAVAYGVAMRSNDAQEVGSLAQEVYDIVFAQGEPPPQILMRDYARGVIERAFWLGAEIDADINRFRPPYNSSWPSIPDNDVIEGLKPEENARVIGRRRIFSSVNGMDFGLYTIGTNSGRTQWLKTHINDERWQLPSEFLSGWEGALPINSKVAWDRFKKIDLCVKNLKYLHKNYDWAKTQYERWNSKASSFPDTPPSDEDVEKAVNAREGVLGRLRTVLETDDVDHFEKAMTAYKSGDFGSPDWFDLSEIQRYVIWRVFDMGWTDERFDLIDERLTRWERGATAKPERFGKKYQWIAYHEMLAFLSGNRQFHDGYDGGDRAYLGPWQLRERDIDPSLTTSQTSDSSGYFDFEPSWWTPTFYDGWDLEGDVSDWLTRNDDLPNISECLLVPDPNGGTRWANLKVFLNWSEDVPAHFDPFEVGRRSVWMASTAVVVRETDLAKFRQWWFEEEARMINWFQGQDFYVGDVFLGEYGWSSSSECFFRYEDQEDGWTRPERDVPVPLRFAAITYNAEANNYDCSIEKTISFELPHRHILNQTGMRWNGRGAEFADTGGETLAFDPSARESGPSSLLIREDVLAEYLASEKMSLVWVVQGRKEYFPGRENSEDYKGQLKISGLSVYSGDENDSCIEASFEEYPVD